MKKMLPKSYLLLLLCLTFLMSGCSELLDCIASARPDLPKKQMITGSVGTVYNDNFQASITNDSHDNSYDYFFSVDTGLPPGIAYHEQGRRLYFTGTPAQSGTFTFKVRLTVNPPDNYGSSGYYDDNDRVCFGDDTTTRDYTIVIQ